MIAEAGHFALVLALMLAIAGVIVPSWGIMRGDERLMQLADRFVLGVFLMVTLAFAALTDAFIASDFSLRIVAANSHTAKPLLYKISGVWGNHEGSLLLWALILALFGAAVSLRGKKLPLRFRARVLSVQLAVAVGFLLFMLLTSNPFDRLEPAALEGGGLNPLLQDPGLAFHPPMLYLGYVGLSVAFSFAIAALLEKEVSPQWARWVRPWTLAAWIFLTGGIALGSWWAYYELGWGGWWFWDPVENASFMPWLAATALLHSAIVVEKRDSLKSWTILLAIIAFSFSLLGTFLVRSGVITSVHAFAVDPARGVFILLFLAVVIGGSLLLFALRAPDMKGGGLFRAISREGALVLNNILLSTFAAAVLIGTLYPLFLEAFDGSQISVGPPTFNFFATVIMSPLVVALGFGPLLAWKRGQLSRTVRWLAPALIIALLVLVVGIWQTTGGYFMTMFGLALAAYLLGAVILELGKKMRIGQGSSRSLLARAGNLKRADWGMSLAHAGLAVIMLAITISEAWTDEKIVALSPGDTVEMAGYDFVFNGVEPYVGANFTAVQANFDIKSSGETLASLTPQARQYHNPVMPTTEASIYPLVKGDLYATIGEQLDDGRWRARLYFKPFISGLWLGTAMMMIGGILSLSDRRLRLARGRREKLEASA